MNIKIIEKKDLFKLSKKDIYKYPVWIVKNFLLNYPVENYKRNIFNFFNKNKPILGSRYTTKKSFWREDNMPEKSNTKRIFRTIYFSTIHNDEFFTTFKKMYDELLHIYQKIFEIEISYSPNKKNYAVRPQIIQYPVGGGFFAEHSHPRFPTDYGLILELSKKERDYNKGQTYFLNNNNKIDIDNLADEKDLILFKYDLPHGVDPVDPEKKLDFESYGRITAVLPILSESD